MAARVTSGGPEDFARRRTPPCASEAQATAYGRPHSPGLGPSRIRSPESVNRRMGRRRSECDRFAPSGFSEYGILADGLRRAFLALESGGGLDRGPPAVLDRGRGWPRTGKRAPPIGPSCRPSVSAEILSPGASSAGSPFRRNWLTQESPRIGLSRRPSVSAETPSRGDFVTRETVGIPFPGASSLKNFFTQNPLLSSHAAERNGRLGSVRARP